VTAEPRPLERSGDFLSLLDEIYGHALSPDEYAWWYERAPAGVATVSEVADGRTLGVLAMSYAQGRVNGEEQLVCFAVGAVTHPEARGRGIFGTLELHNEVVAAGRGTPIALGFTNPMAGPILVGKLGWEDLYRMRLWARPLRLRRGGATALGPRGGPYLERFGPGHEWRPESGLVRDVAYLTWRYLDAPKDYRLVGDEQGFAAVAFAVQKGFSAGVVLDVIGRPVRPLLRRAVREARGCDVVVGVPLPGQRRAWLSCGFVPSPLTIRVIGKRLHPDAALPGEWQFTLGDTDFF
jgi:hypothetical protein